MLTINITKKKNPIIFKNVTYDPSIVEIRDLYNGKVVRKFAGVDNARNWLNKDHVRW